MALPFKISLRAEERQALIEALPEDAPLRRKLESLRDRTAGTAGAHEFRGFHCKHCDEQTPHRRKYKTKDPFVCDECGEQY